MVDKILYKKELTYLVVEINGGEYIRWNISKALFYAGSEADALEGLPIDECKAVLVSDCPEDIQKEYEAIIDKGLKDGELELRDILPSSISVDLYHYIDDEGNLVVDEETMIDEFSSFLKSIEIICEKYKK